MGMNRNLTDGLNFASKLTLRRAWNSVKVVASYYYSRLAGQAYLPAMPISISIEPTTSCNLRCPECPSGLRSFTRPTGMLDQALFKKVIDELAPTLPYLIFYFQGEPYLHPALLEMVGYASQKKIYTATSTNAHYLSDEMARKTVESGLDRMVVSIDGVDQEAYSAYRIGGRLSKVIEGTRNIIKWKRALKSKTPHVVFQFLVVRHNEGQVDRVFKLAKELGVDEVALKTAQVYNYEDGSDLIPVNEKYSRYKKRDDGTYTIKNGLANHCWKMWHSCVVTWDGKVVPCCFDKDAHYVLGDLKRNTFKEIWEQGKYQHFRQSLLRSRKELEICRNCTEGTKVWA